VLFASSIAIRHSPFVLMKSKSWLAPGPVHTLRAGALTMKVAPALGGRIASLASVGNGGRIDWLAPMSDACLRYGFDGQVWPKAGCYPLLPFSNRIRDGRFQWGGREIRLAPHPGQPHAMHGLAHARAWEVEQCSGSSIELGLRYVPEPDHWPWPFTAQQTLTLSTDRLEALMTLRNDGDSDMPAGGGFHPYIARGPGMRVQFDAATMWPIDAGEVAIRREPITAREDFRRARALPDDTLSVYYSDWKQRAVVSREDGATLALSADEPLDHFILHAPAGQPYVCLEPVSHVADAVNLARQGWGGTGLRALAPGETMQLRMRFHLAAVS
jgi:aldose 1-epimerase